MAILKQWNGSDWVNVVASGVVAVDDTPVDGSTTTPVSSNWAYDHAQANVGPQLMAAIQFGALI